MDFIIALCGEFLNRKLDIFLQAKGKTHTLLSTLFWDRRFEKKRIYEHSYVRDFCHTT